MQPDICSRKSHNEPHSFLANLAIAGHKQSLRERIYVSLRDDGALSPASNYLCDWGYATRRFRPGSRN